MEDSAVADRLLELVQTFWGVHGGPLLAAELKIPFRDLSALMTASRPLTAEVGKRICELCGNASEDWLFRGIGTMYPEAGFSDRFS